MNRKETDYYLLSNFITFLWLSRTQFNTSRYYKKWIEFDRRKVIRINQRSRHLYIDANDTKLLLLVCGT